MKQFQEVAPPGFGHTKSDKKKGVEKGGTAAAFDRARKRGDFKGTKSDMFAIMWSQKNKGDKPHYKPGTDEKKKKYQEEVVLEKDLNAAERRALPNSDFALPGKGEGPKGKQAGSYPIPDEKQARSALSLVAQHGTSAEKATVRAKVKKKFPNIEQNESVVLDANTKIKTDGKKKKNDAIRAQRAKEDHRDETEKATSGRYNDRSRSD